MMLITKIRKYFFQHITKKTQHFKTFFFKSENIKEVDDKQHLINTKILTKEHILQSKSIKELIMKADIELIN